MKFKIRNFVILLFVLVSPIFLASCSRQPVSTTSKPVSSPFNSDVHISLARGDFTQTDHIITCPVVVKNEGKNSTVLDSEKFTLNIGKYSIKPFILKQEPTDFHVQFDSGDVWNSTLTFYIGSHLSDKQLRRVSLTYLQDNNRKSVARVLSDSVNEDKIQGNSQNNDNLTDLGTYYSNIKQYISDQRQDQDNGQDSSDSLDDQFNDPNYDKFRIWFVVAKKTPNNVIIKAENKTNTDFDLPFENFQLESHFGDDVQVAPQYRNYTLNIPHGKFVTATIPMESPLALSSSPYSVQFSTSDDQSTYFSVKKVFYPPEVVFSNASDITNAFELEPDQYVTNGQINISKPRLKWNDDEIDCRVHLMDYFALKNKKSNFKLAAINNGSTEKVLKPIQVTPSVITSTNSTLVQFGFSNNKLAKMKHYAHLSLMYNHTTILKIK